MDPVTMTFYAIICGGLAAAAPSFGSRAKRTLSGAVVGIVGALILPWLRSATGI